MLAEGEIYQDNKIKFNDSEKVSEVTNQETPLTFQGQYRPSTQEPFLEVYLMHTRILPAVPNRHLALLIIINKQQ